MVTRASSFSQNIFSSWILLRAKPLSKTFLFKHSPGQGSPIPRVLRKTHFSPKPFKTFFFRASTHSAPKDLQSGFQRESRVLSTLSASSGIIGAILMAAPIRVVIYGVVSECRSNSFTNGIMQFCKPKHMHSNIG